MKIPRWCLLLILSLTIWRAPFAFGVKLPPVLKWGADSEGGAPYVFQDPADPKRIIGFEVDLMEALAKELGVTAEFVQNSWDGLIPGLDGGQYHVAVNGIEITPDR